MQWDGYEFLFDDTQPDLVALVGDLTDDGFRGQSITTREHVDQFYQLLKYASKKSKVLVIRGNHDKDENYLPDRSIELSILKP